MGKRLRSQFGLISRSALKAGRLIDGSNVNEA